MARSGCLVSMRQILVIIYMIGLLHLFTCSYVFVATLETSPVVSQTTSSVLQDTGNGTTEADVRPTTAISPVVTSTLNPICESLSYDNSVFTARQHSLLCRALY